MSKTNAQPELVPRLRFPEFRDARGWNESALTKICDVNPTHDGLPESFYYIDLESVEAGTLQNPQWIERENAPSRAQRLLRAGDILYQTVRPYQRNNLLFNFTDREDYVASTGYAQLRARESISFLYQLIHTDSFVERVLAKCTGSSYPAINSSVLESVSVWIPPDPAEQRKIAACLGSLDDLIAAEGRKLAALRDHKKGLMQQLFPRPERIENGVKLPPETRPRLRFPEFRKSYWVNRSIGDVLQEASRPIDMDDEAEYSLVTVKRRYGGVVPREVLQGKAIKVKSQFLVMTDDFLISKRQIVHDACGLVPSDLNGSIVSNEYSVLTPREGCDITFFNYFAQQPCVSKSFLDSSVGIVIEKMLFKLEWWLKHEFVFPTLEEQRAIADCLSSLDAMIAAQAEQLDALRTHKRGLMQQLFPTPEGVEA